MKLRWHFLVRTIGGEPRYIDLLGNLSDMPKSACHSSFAGAHAELLRRVVAYTMCCADTDLIIVEQIAVLVTDNGSQARRANPGGHNLSVVGGVPVKRSADTRLILRRLRSGHRRTRRLEYRTHVR